MSRFLPLLVLAAFVGALTAAPVHAQSDPLGANPMDQMLDRGTSGLGNSPMDRSHRSARRTAPQRAADPAPPGMGGPGGMEFLAPGGGAPPPMPAAPAQSPVDGGLALLLGAGAIYAARRLRQGREDAPLT